MKIRRDLVVAVLATFCLTATLFMIGASRSDWDPWADIKEDGVVDIFDAITLANAYGTSGDTTKNVTIAGHATYEWAETVHMLPESSWHCTNSTAGYESFSILIQIFAPAPGTKLSVQLRYRIGYQLFELERFEMNDTDYLLVKEYPVSASTIEVSIYNGDVMADCYIGIYMRA